MIDLKDNNYYENLEEKLEALKAENNNLLSKLKKFETLARFDGSFSTVVSSDNYNNETSLVDNISTTSTASNNLPSMSSPSISTSSKPFKLEDYITVLNNDLNTVNQSIEDDSDEIWEKLNSRCHKKFGYNNEIKQPTREDIKWGADILPIYAEWKKLKDFKCLIEKWIAKINEYMQKNDMLSSSPTLISSSSSFSTLIQPSPSSTSVPLSFVSLIKGKKVRDNVNESIEVVKINVDNKNEVDEDVEIMEIDVENDDIQNEETEDKAKKNLEAKELKEKKFKKFGKISYRPYLVSSNKKNAKKVVINRYAKGSNKYRAKNLSENIYKSTEIVDEDRNNDEWIDIDIIKEDENYSSAKNTYKNAQKNLSENWRKISPKLFDIMIENNAINKDSKCFKCNSPAICYCLDCGLNTYLCLECNTLYHKDINLFHRKVFISNIFDKEEIKLPQLCTGFCEHEIKEISIINLKGIFKAKFPTCEGLVETLIRHKLFPSTPINPQVAFSFELFDIYQELLLEAHVSYLSFCRVLESLFSDQDITRNIYYLFKSAFHQYLGLKTMIENTINKLFSSKSQFNCPACPQPEEKNSKIIIALDANFQLKRMKSAGSNIGIGERFSLAEYILSDLHNMFYEDSSTFIVLYDIACNLHSHVEKSESRLFPFKSRFNWCVSIFHAYAHSMKCQLNYHPRACNSIGLTDGESLERLWSYLGRFSSTTRYMRPHHRLDILEKGIQHISRKMISNLACNLVKRIEISKANHWSK
ncbi:hypothetical protein GLOIN_2v1886648 [Rhizophagus irregularis DAOM 181602=DAOM 197198]|nr:hypothetical protein GLOIN_2v1886648 [Rhizophagus irregularis DAOM 181602=DAOM 197198]